MTSNSTVIHIEKYDHDTFEEEAFIMYTLLDVVFNHLLVPVLGCNRETIEAFLELEASGSGCLVFVSSGKMYPDGVIEVSLDNGIVEVHTNEMSALDKCEEKYKTDCPP